MDQCSRHRRARHPFSGTALLTASKGTVSAQGWTIRPGSASAHPPAATRPESAVQPTRASPIRLYGQGSAEGTRPEGAPLRLEGPARTMRGALVPARSLHILRAHAHLARARRPGRGAGGRQRDTARTAAAGHRAAERGSRRVVGLGPKDAAKLPPATARPQVEPWPLTASLWPIIPSRLLASALAVHGGAVRPGAPEVRS
jgi:hypothetical protein